MLFVLGLETLVATSVFAAKRNELFESYFLNLEWAYFCSVISGGAYIITSALLAYYVLEQRQLGYDSPDPLLTFSGH